jgi:hypothetical protein
MMELLLRYDWPGNVRQLRNVVRTALIVGTGPSLSLSGAPWIMAELSAPAAAAATRPASLLLRDVERQAIFEALRLTHSHQVKAARLLGITDRTLREKLRRYRNEGPPAEPAGARCRNDCAGDNEEDADGRAAALLPCGRAGRAEHDAPPWMNPGAPETPVAGAKPCLIART